MRPFVFPLQSALAWRATQLELEENRLRRISAMLEEIALSGVRLEMAGSRAQQSVREAAAVEAGDLWALAAYRRRLTEERQALEKRREACQREQAAQRQRVLEAQRHCRLLERLGERRRAEWRREADRELESLASESFLARWKSES